MRLPRQLRQAGPDEVVDVVAVRECEQRLAERGCVHRQQRSDLEQLEARVRSEHMVDDEDAARVRHADADRLADPRREQLRPRERARAQLVEIEIAVAELQQLGAELVLVGVEVLFDEAVLLQRPEQAVHGRLREPDAVSEVGEAEPPRVLAERLEDAHGTVDGLNCFHEAIVESRSTL
jgi:hypothetical protein